MRCLPALPCLLLLLLACDRLQPGERTKTLEAQAGKQAERIASKVAGAMDKALQKDAYELKPNPALDTLGLQATRAQRLKEPAGSHGITVYLVADQALAGSLELRALDAKGLEVGRARASTRLEAGSARYVDFTFDPRTPLDEVDRVELRVLR